MTNSFRGNPVVYFLLTDRFLCAGKSGLGSYGRFRDRKGIGTFHGGNFAGIAQKLREGWFSALGVNAIWISAPYEQIHNWVLSNDNFCYEAYHGYWPLDFTCVDKNFGDELTFREMVDIAHEVGIKVILDVVMSHVGYPDLLIVNQGLPPMASDLTGGVSPEEFTQDSTADTLTLRHWWDATWIYADLPGYPPGGNDDLTRINFGLPKLRTDCNDFVELPPFLKTKPDTYARDLPEKPVRSYLIEWLTKWVRSYGIDGFRCDSARHVGLDCWRNLKTSGNEALQEWRKEREDIDNTAFWMLGEVYGHGIQRSEYFDHGFDSILNFSFQHHIKSILLGVAVEEPYGRTVMWRRLDKMYTQYSNELCSGGHDVLSYLSSHDTELFDRRLLRYAATALMLLPGGIQLFYGDESARLPSDVGLGDPVHGTRSDMNWDSIDHALLSHWRKLGQFRKRHIALARGAHQRLCPDPYVFCRSDSETRDKVIVALGPGRARVNVAGLFENGQTLFDSYNCRLVQVIDNQLVLDVDEILLLEDSRASI